MRYFSVGAIFQQENFWLDEWIRYYGFVGAERIHLYNHDHDTRVSDAILRPYVDAGFVENIHVHDHEELKSLPKALTQPAAMRDLLIRTAGRTHWLAIVDLDEFILPRKVNDIPTILQDYEDASVLAVSWLRYGSSGRIKRPPSQINGFLHHVRLNSQSCRFFKCIVRPELIDTEAMITRTRIAKVPHAFPLRSGVAVNENHEPIDMNSYFMKHTGEKIVINHYAIRSFQDFWEVKVPRGRFNGMPDFDPDHFERYDENDVFNDEISKRFGHLVD